MAVHTLDQKPSDDDLNADIYAGYVAMLLA
jgi:hypothetical protein